MAISVSRCSKTRHGTILKSFLHVFYIKTSRLAAVSNSFSQKDVFFCGQGLIRPVGFDLEQASICGMWTHFACCQHAPMLILQVVCGDAGIVAAIIGQMEMFATSEALQEFHLF